MPDNRTAFTTFPDIPLDKPFTDDMVQVDSDCYGVAWKPDHSRCSICAAKVYCGIKYQRNLKPKTLKAAVDAGGYLDETSFDEFDQSQFVADVILNPGKISVDELFDKLQKLSKCPDEDTIAFYIKSMIVDHPIKTKGGMFYPKAG